MDEKEIIGWLLKGDVSIQYQVYRDLLEKDRPALRKRIATEGWGKRLLSQRHANGHWGLRFYQPKWISTHYTLLDLRNLGILPDCIPIRETIAMILENEKGPDGGIYPIGTIKASDVCINGMALNYCSYFGAKQKDLHSVIDFLLSVQMPDGGFNCMSNTNGAVHSSLHTTLSVLEGIEEYRRYGYTYRLEELLHTAATSREYILAHRLYKSRKTGEVIDKKMTSLAYPSRWRFDFLRALDYFRYAGIQYDERMSDGLNLLIEKRNKENTWNLNAHYPGKQHFIMEQAGKPSRWNTLRALRVLKHFPG